MKLAEVIQKVESFAPLRFAGSWDNVGLLIDPMTPDKPVKTLLLTNDLTEDVMQEAVHTKSDMILSYHPPIFRPLKRLTANNWKERIAIKCLTNGIAVYSPHTSLDAVQGGVNDWLIQPFGKGKVTPLEEIEEGVGPGRLLELSDSGDPSASLTLDGAVSKIKQHLNMDKVRLAVKIGGGTDHSKIKVRSIAVCAGSGGSVLNTPLGKKADLWLTGEMSHHEVLDATHLGISVVLCDHSNTERGYLANDYAKMLKTDLDGVSVLVSQSDMDPLQVV